MAEAVRIGPIAVDLCSRACGLWLDVGELNELRRIAESDRIRDDIVSLLGSLRKKGAASPRAYIPCPVCTELMQQYNHLESTGILLDRCARHGVWLDRDDAIRLLGLVASEEEIEARNAERKRTELERRLNAAEMRLNSHDSRISAQRMMSRIHLALDALDII